MQEFKLNKNRIHFIGTSHIAEQSVKEIEEYILNNKPTVIAVELDKQRLQGLLQKRKDRISLKNIGLIRKVGITGFIFAYIASTIQRTLGSKMNIQAGSDMLTAVKLAKKHDIKIALIDQNVDVTLRKLSKEMKFGEKMRIVWDVLKGFLTGETGAEELGIKKMNFKKVPQDELVEKVITKTKDRYPSFYKVLVHDRNKFMIKNLFNLMIHHPNETILAVVGAGHKKEMKELLDKKLEKLNSGQMDIVSSYSFSVDMPKK
jgi:pheromone shutdown-related protein TraB